MPLSVFPLALIAIGIYELVKYLVNRCKGREGDPYQELQNLVASALPGESGCRVVYGCYETAELSEFTTRFRRTAYYCYAIAFRSDCLWAAPLGFDQKSNKMRLTAPMVPVCPEELGMITVNANKKKSTLVLSLYRKNHRCLLRCNILAKNRRSNRFRHANICQPEACEALCEQMSIWAERVNLANMELPVHWKTENTKQEMPATSLVLGIVGLALGFMKGPLGLLLMPIGMLLGLIGLLKARAAKKSGAIVPKGYIILDIVAMAVGLLKICFVVMAFYNA